MLDITRPKIQIPDDSKITINQYRNPYLTKLTVKILPNFHKINGPTLFNPLMNYNNVAIVQSLPLWRNQKFRIGLLWQQNIRNSFNRSHIGLSAEYQMKNNWTLRSKNLVGSSFLSATQLSKVKAISGNIITFSGLYSTFFQSSSDIYHTIGASVAINNSLSFSVNKRIGSQTSFQTNYERKLQHDLFLRVKYGTDVQKINEGQLQIGLGYYITKSLSSWLRTSIQSNKMQPNLAVELQLKQNKNAHCFISSVQYRNQKSILYLGYKCPSFNFIFPIFGTDSVIPAIIGLGVFIFGYMKRKHHAFEKYQKQEKLQIKKNRIQQLKLTSDKANENYKKQQQIRGLLIQQVYIGEKQLLNRFLRQQNKQGKLNRFQIYRNGICDGTISFRFYVQKSQLFLPKGNKHSTLGLQYKTQQQKQVQVYIKYSKRGKQYQKLFKIQDEIKI